MKQMRLRYSGVCWQCGTSIAAGSEAIYESESRTVRCLACSTEPIKHFLRVRKRRVAGCCHLQPARQDPLPDASMSDAKPRTRIGSARNGGRFGALAVALSDERPSTQSWAQGAIGEERLGARLDAASSDSLAVLHDRRIPGSKANIDHIAVTPGGVWVIDAKRYKGRPELKIEGGFLHPRVEKLLVGRRDSTKLVDGVLKQVDVVREHAGAVPVNGVLCFIEADWPLVGGSLHDSWRARTLAQTARKSTCNAGSRRC